MCLFYQPCEKEVEETYHYVSYNIGHHKRLMLVVLCVIMCNERCLLISGVTDVKKIHYFHNFFKASRKISS